MDEKKIDIYTLSKIIQVIIALAVITIMLLGDLKMIKIPLWFIIIVPIQFIVYYFTIKKETLAKNASLDRKIQTKKIG